MWCAKCVFRCFRSIERFTDRLTGAAGPFFVTFAVVLLLLGLFTFCTWLSTSLLKLLATTNLELVPVEVIQPTLRWQLLSLPINLLIVINVFGQYYLACTVKPGFIDEPAMVEGDGWMWAKRRRDSTRYAGGDSSGVRWSEDLNLNMTRANVTRCKKCKLLRPDVSHPFALENAL